MEGETLGKNIILSLLMLAFVVMLNGIVIYNIESIILFFHKTFEISLDDIGSGISNVTMAVSTGFLLPILKYIANNHKILSKVACLLIIGSIGSLLSYMILINSRPMSVKYDNCYIAFFLFKTVTLGALIWFAQSLIEKIFNGLADFLVRFYKKMKACILGL